MCVKFVCVKLLYVKFVYVKLLYVKFVRVKFVCVKLLYVKFVCVKFVCVWSYCMLSLCMWSYCMLSLCVLSLCVWSYCVCVLLVCVREAAGGGEGVPEEPGIQNQKQEPHTKMWGTTCLDRFWKLRWWKSARRCGAKHISKSKCLKHTMFGPLLEVVMSKKCTPLWREADVEVDMFKNTPCSDHFWKLRWWKSARRCGAKHI